MKQVSISVPVGVAVTLLTLLLFMLVGTVLLLTKLGGGGPIVELNYSNKSDAHVRVVQGTPYALPSRGEARARRPRPKGAR